MKSTFLLTMLLTAATLHGQTPSPAEPSVRFMVFSDPHYYDPSLGTTGPAFEAYLDNDRKLLAESRELLLEAIEMINASDAAFVIVPGDLTKDGTKVSHTEFARLMKQIEAEGRPVYVIPGNHDVSNGESRAFSGDTSYIVENVSPETFAVIHNDFGYGEAFSRDAHSLSYVTEPAEGIWLLGLDACLYDHNQPGHHPHTDGAFKKETLEWVKEIAGKAHEQEKQIIAFMHHGVTEHYPGQEKFYGEYVVNDHEAVSELFAALGIRVMFTGHYHAQDVTLKKFSNGDFIYDVETGSLVTYPCPVREVTLNGDVMDIRSHFIGAIPSRPDDFQAFSEQYVYDGIAGIAERTLISYKLKPGDAKMLSGQIADAFIAHYSGDETLREDYLDMRGVGLMGRIIILFKKKLVKSLYMDLPPADNDVVLTLTKE